MLQVVQACKAGDSDRPPSYRVVEDSELRFDYELLPTRFALNALSDESRAFVLATH